MPSYAYHSGLHRFALALSVCVFLLIVAGALVTSNGAGLAVPDWPTSFGSLYRIPPMTGGIKYEHGHRMLAELVGFLTIILAIWTERTDERSWMRKLGWLALAMVIVQGVLGGITVRMLLPWYVSSAHAMVAQTFFALTLMMAVFTGQRWLNSEPSPVMKTSNLRLLSYFSIAALYGQLFMGAAFRHGGMHFLPHIIGAVFVTILLVWTCIQALIEFAQVRAVRGMAIATLALLILQLGLGFAAYLTRVVWGVNAPQPMPSMVWTTVAHTAVGALVLAHAFMLAIQVTRHSVADATVVTSTNGTTKVVTA